GEDTGRGNRRRFRVAAKLRGDATLAIDQAELDHLVEARLRAHAPGLLESSHCLGNELFRVVHHDTMLGRNTPRTIIVRCRAGPGPVPFADRPKRMVATSW